MRSVTVGSSLALPCSNITTRKPSARVTEPASGAISPDRMRNSVLLPLPLGPSRPSLRARREPQVEVGEQRSSTERLRNAERRQQLACLPAGGDEVDAGRGGGGVAVVELGQFLGAARWAASMREPALRVRAAALRPSHSVSRRTWLATVSCRWAWASRNASRRSAKSSYDPAERKEPAWIDPAHLDDLVGRRPQERPVVRGDQIAEWGGPQQPLQPRDARQIEVIGRLVQQQEVGTLDQLAGQRQSLPPASGERIDHLLRIDEADLGQCDGGPSRALVFLERLLGQRIEQHGLHGLSRERTRPAEPGRRAGMSGAATVCRRPVYRGRRGA